MLDVFLEKVIFQFYFVFSGEILKLFSACVSFTSMHSSVSHSLNEAPIPYNVLLLNCRPSIVAHPPAVPMYIATGLASVGLWGVRWLWSIETFRLPPDQSVALGALGCRMWKQGWPKCTKAILLKNNSRPTYEHNKPDKPHTLVSRTQTSCDLNIIKQIWRQSLRKSMQKFDVIIRFIKISRVNSGWFWLCFGSISVGFIYLVQWLK